MCLTIQNLSLVCLSFRLHQGIEEDAANEDVQMFETEEEEQVVPQTLWVERYAPHRYTDLLSEEAINRYIVFTGFGVAQY